MDLSEEYKETFPILQLKNKSGFILAEFEVKVKGIDQEITEDKIASTRNESVNIEYAIWNVENRQNSLIVTESVRSHDLLKPRTSADATVFPEKSIEKSETFEA